MYEPYFYQEIGSETRRQQPTSQPPIRTKYTIEFKVLSDRTQAEQLVKQLNAKGIEAFYTPLNRGGQVVFRVRYGIFGTAESAKKERQRLSTQWSAATRITRF
jgi:cell division septation protein DedD